MELVFLVQIVPGQIWAEHQVQHELDRAAAFHVTEKVSEVGLCERVSFLLWEWNRVRQLTFSGGGERKRLLIKITAAICIFSDVRRAAPGNLQPVLIWFTSDLFPHVKDSDLMTSKFTCLFPTCLHAHVTDPICLISEEKKNEAFSLNPAIIIWKDKKYALWTQKSHISTAFNVYWKLLWPAPGAVMFVFDPCSLCADGGRMQMCVEMNELPTCSLNYTFIIQHIW